MEWKSTGSWAEKESKNQRGRKQISGRIALVFSLLGVRTAKIGPDQVMEGCDSKLKKLERNWFKFYFLFFYFYKKS
jgi:hypothetical protein